MTQVNVQRVADRLREIAGRPGQKLTRRDCELARLAACLIEAHDAEMERHFGAYRSTLYDFVAVQTELKALKEGLQALREVTA